MPIELFIIIRCEWISCILQRMDETTDNTDQAVENSVLNRKACISYLIIVTSYVNKVSF